MTSTNQAIASAQRILETIKDDDVVAQAIKANDPRSRGLNTFTRQNILRTQSVNQLWKTIGRQVLAIHPEIVDEVKVATSDKIPGEVFRVLPYMNPLVTFSEPPEFKTWVKFDPKGEDRMRLLGFMTFGSAERINDTRDIDQLIMPTNDPDAERLGMLLVFEALDSKGNVIDVEFNSITLFFDSVMTLGENVEALMERFHWDDTNEGEAKQAKRWMREVLSVVVGSLFYLCSTTLEAEKVPAKATKQLGRGITRKPLSFFRVGWTTGGALTRYRQSRSNSTSEQTGPEHQMQDPQHRRSHFKLQPCGKGKVDRKLIFVSAYWTHKERLGEEGVNTARAVPRVNGKGSAAESARVAMVVGK